MALSTPYIFDNSPIEFILVGPLEGKDVVLVQSKSPGLDLFGLANHRFAHLKKAPASGLLSNILTNKEREIHVVESDGERDIHSYVDDRLSLYRFIWVGGARHGEIEQFRVDFIDSLYSIIVAIAEGNSGALSVLIGGLVLQCTAFDKRRIQTKQNLRLILGIYLIGAVILIYYMFFRFNNPIFE